MMRAVRFLPEALEDLITTQRWCRELVIIPAREGWAAGTWKAARRGGLPMVRV